MGQRTSAVVASVLLVCIAAGQCLADDASSVDEFEIRCERWSWEEAQRNSAGVIQITCQISEGDGPIPAGDPALPTSAFIADGLESVLSTNLRTILELVFFGRLSSRDVFIIVAPRL